MLRHEQNETKKRTEATTVKMLINLIVALLMTVTLMACSSSGEVAEIPDNLQLIHWTIFNPESESDPRNIALKNIVEKWNSENKWGATMKVESINHTDLHLQFSQAAAAGNPPDVILAFSTNLDQYIDAGGIQPMTEFATKWIQETDDYIYTVDALTKSDGEIYSLPWETRCMLLYYRTDIYGETPNFENLDDLARRSAAQTTGNNFGFVLGCAAHGDFLQQLQPILYAFGARTYDDDMNIVINSPEGVKAIEWLKSLYDNGCMNDTAVMMNIEDTFNALRAGTTYAIILGSHRYGAVKNTAEIGDKIGVVAIPGIKPGSIAPAYNTSQTLGIGKNCKYPEVAFDFIKSNITAEAGVRWFEASCMPVRTSVYEMSSVADSPMAATMSEWKTIWDTGLENFFFEPSYNARLSILLAEAVQDIIINDKDVQSTLDAVVAQFQQ
jgi:ABC-type glycerol-3-phosphate transport system substrate-binding protein